MIEQNTPEWEEMRKGKIGASDSPIIMGVSPYKTPFSLWQEKLSLSAPKRKLAHLESGHDMEPKARSVLEQELGMPLFPSVKLHNQRSWMMASIDAMSFDERTIAEIKCPGGDDHSYALDGKVPEKYFPQLQHQMEVCELEYAYYFSFDGEKGVVIKVFRDEKYIKGMLKEEEKFFECMKNFEAPPLTNRDYQLQSDPKWIHLAMRWTQIASAKEQIEREEQEIKDQLISICDGQSSMGSGIKVARCARKGAVEYAKIPELKGINLDAYRKKPTEYWRILNGNTH